MGIQEWRSAVLGESTAVPVIRNSAICSILQKLGSFTNDSCEAKSLGTQPELLALVHGSH